MSGGRGVYGKENPRTPYAVGLPAEPARLVRGSSRRITIMRFRPANIRVINRRENRLDRDSRRFLSESQKKEKQLIVVDGSFHIRWLVPYPTDQTPRDNARLILTVSPTSALGNELSYLNRSAPIDRGKEKREPNIR